MEPCPICGFQNNPADSGYCTECGAKLITESTPAQPTPQPTPPPPQQPTTPPPPPPQQSSLNGSLKLPDGSVIQIDTAQKVVGRIELLNYLKSVQGIDPMVISRQHFTISQQDGKYYLEDGKTNVQEKSSGNHTYLNGTDITEKGQQELKNGDVIDLANTVKLTFNLQ